jgi:RNA-directed DNA polymerase
VLDIDVKGYFDSIDWELLLKAVRHRTNCAWVLLYIERCLKAPVQMEGGGVSPLLANLFLHYAFDVDIAKLSAPTVREGYADDSICHCKSAEEVRSGNRRRTSPRRGRHGHPVN